MADCHGDCGEPVPTEDGSDSICELMMFGEPDRWWHRGCWASAQLLRPRNRALLN